MGLYAETEYQCWVYVEDDASTMSAFSTGTFTTDDLPDAYKFTINFAGEVSMGELEALRGFTAVCMGIQFERLLNGVAAQTTASDGTTVTATTFVWDVPAKRFV